MDIVVLGDVMVDVLATLHAPFVPDADNPADFVQALGGQAANTAAWIDAAGSRAHLVGAVGADSHGTWVTERLRARRIEYSLSTMQAATGQCIVITEPAGGRTMLPNSGANAMIAASGARQQVVALLEGGAKHLHISGYVPLHDADFARQMVLVAGERGVSTSMDTPAVFPDSLWANRADDSSVSALPPVDILLGTAPELPRWLRNRRPAVRPPAYPGSGCHRPDAGQAHCPTSGPPTDSGDQGGKARRLVDHRPGREDRPHRRPRGRYHRCR